jgi:NADPH dehydrogenase (quinone)
MQKALIINAHLFFEGISSGKLNETMVGILDEELVKRGYAVKHTNIEKGYDINEEVDKHAEADLIILQSPVYWFGNPWIYKKYVDEVFTAGLFQNKLLTDDGRTREDPSKQYGSGGKLQGSKYMLSLTWNAPAEAFGDKSQTLFDGKTVDDVFVANTANYKFCGVEILPSFSCFNVVKEADVEGDIKRLREHLARVL